MTDVFPIAPPLVSIQWIKDGAATITTDPIDGPLLFPAPSLLATFNQGPGVYTVLVDKTAVGAENYRIDVFCRNVNGVALATTVVKTQYQSVRPSGPPRRFHGRRPGFLIHVASEG